MRAVGMEAAVDRRELARTAAPYCAAAACLVLAYALSSMSVVELAPAFMAAFAAAAAAFGIAFALDRSLFYAAFVAVFFAPMVLLAASGTAP